MKTINNSRRWIIPLVTGIVCLLSFGLLIPWLGFYWDDWPIITAARLQGVNAFWDYYRFERPISAWMAIATTPLLGDRAWGWHLSNLAVRWLTVLGVWWGLSGLWPQRACQISWVTLLFAIYPVFTQQPVAATFIQHWICFALYSFSLGAMIYAIRCPRWFWPLSLLAYLATLVHTLSLEYFWGLELLRPLILWLVMDNDKDARHRLRRTLQMWAPYFLILVGVVTWRMFFMPIVRTDPNRPELLIDLASQPLGTLLRLAQISMQDLLYNLWGAWYETFQPAQIDLADRAVLASWVVAVLTTGLCMYVFFYLERNDTSQGDNSDGRSATSAWVRQALLLGLVGAILGPLPVWLKDRQSLVGLYSGRFALAAMFGLSILWVGLLEWFTPRRLPKILLVGIMIGLAAGFHVRNATSFYRSTLRQNDFYWQLTWRAPHVQSGTMILSTDELFLYVGREATASAVNLIYPQPAEYRDTYNVGYWFLELDHNVGAQQLTKYLKGRPVTRSFRTFNYSGSSLDSLVVFYKPGSGRCLWVLSAADADIPILPDLTRTALPLSNLGRIQAQPAASGYPPVEIFGREPSHTWCYYYQKAELAYQMGDWQSVAQLAGQAQRQGFAPSDAEEYRPFIEAYAHLGQWENAKERTLAAYHLNETIAPRLCQWWDQMKSMPGATEEISGSLREQLGCEMK